MLTDVPHYPQQDHQCGPAAVAAILAFTGAEVAMPALISELYVPEREGTLQAEILATLRRHERIAYVLPPRIDAVMTEVAGGNPVLVLLNLGFSWYPRWHYAVVIGFDNQHATVSLRFGREALRTLPLSTFGRVWARGRNWAVVALPPGDIPVGAEALPYLEAANAFEILGKPQIAIDAYRGALGRWPESVVAQLGLANSYYAAGRLDEAEAAYRRLLDQHPEYGPALNNLAQTLAERGDLAAAETIAEKAVMIGGPRRTAYAATLSEIRAQIRERRLQSAPEHGRRAGPGALAGSAEGSPQRGSNR